MNEARLVDPNNEVAGQLLNQKGEGHDSPRTESLEHGSRDNCGTGYSNLYVESRERDREAFVGRKKWRKLKQIEKELMETGFTSAVNLPVKKKRPKAQKSVNKIGMPILNQGRFLLLLVLFKKEKMINGMYKEYSFYSLDLQQFQRLGGRKDNFEFELLCQCFYRKSVQDGVISKQL